jgi:hypothetical protein
MLEQYKTIHTLLNIPYLQPPHPTVRQLHYGSMQSEREQMTIRRTYIYIYIYADVMDFMHREHLSSKHPYDSNNHFNSPPKKLFRFPKL